MIEIRFGIQVDMSAGEDFGLALDEQLGEPVSATFSTTRIVADSDTGARVIIEGDFDLTSEESLLSSSITRLEILAPNRSLIFSIAGLSDTTFGSFADGSAVQLLEEQLTLGAVIHGSRFDDVLAGGPGTDTLNGGAGDDVLVGAGGNDTLSGQVGNDTYFIFGATGINIAVADPGTDTVRTSISYALGEHQEDLVLFGARAIDGTGNASDNALSGNSANNRLNGGGGDDVLDGRGGSDVLAGGAGNDTYVIDRATEIARGVSDGGTDTVKSTVDYLLGGAQERLILAGAQAIGGTGNRFDNTLAGNGAANQLNGMNGDDLLRGNEGADTLIGGTGNDHLMGQQGEDSVIGGDGDDALEGHGANDTLAGGEGNDVLDGASGLDTLNGGGGNDSLDSGAGNDRLSGGFGNDVFLFNDAFGPGNVDSIMDFGGAGTAALDVIHLDAAVFSALPDSGTLDAQHFVSGSNPAALDGDDYILYDTGTGELFYDADGSGNTFSAVAFAVLATDPDALAAVDFMVI